ncbi:hypothetical protein SAY87_027529 [Trapa incisa]|uniref:Uncharacterized protein n=1 Tax=Trapa incisa TaxID=236973 RepID=A0AAN7PQI8_9MYRT|nr:hypothetical protein SAY87_027529 [Trapa incisa]
MASSLRLPLTPISAINAGSRINKDGTRHPTSYPQSTCSYKVTSTQYSQGLLQVTGDIIASNGWPNASTKPTFPKGLLTPTSSGRKLPCHAMPSSLSQLAN